MRRKTAYFEVVTLIKSMVLTAAIAVSIALYAQKNTDQPPDKTLPNIIVIDPGHPSETSNGCAHHGLTELQICWDVALKLEKLLTALPDVKVIKTKEKADQFVTNKERAEIANAAKANLMIRLHCDSGKGTGCTLYYPDKPGTKMGFTGPSQEVIAQSLKAAEAIQTGLAKTLKDKLQVNPIKTDSDTYVGSRQGALTGSIFSRVPTVVIEMVYLNNASDAAFIKDEAGQNLMAKALLEGIKEFISKRHQEIAQ
ncbi:MAG: hypothetical protein Kow0029_18680 [Candidatus Rifleibacteriota bacterium]